ncbi:MULTISPECIES: hypothetical protein [Oerskovia]|uniref:Antitoxin HicB n=1 Tax=Oerskovia merdavium TaxID=2762227 RepID=A0ABR8TWF3_9CELL|nr:MULTISPECIES: hypothetical protein [Oerskovia]KRD35258.1 hypothetical protein ASE27_15850 [Oerskovia sp. Root918]MBD7980118.1 antitoxin HicB [Oerskovia merdavium]
MSSTTYQAQVRRDGRWWFVYVPELDTAGQARTLSEARDVAQEVIGLYLDIEPETVSVELEIELPEAARELWTVAAEREAEARAAVAAAAAMRREAIRKMTHDGISQADSARALGISQQRVSQLIHS